ncbi:MAG: hypothetical protein IPJ05_06070 [Nitrosomonas sp.]|nr:hypothetical protein [Nitrosomonas sp.]
MKKLVAIALSAMLIAGSTFVFASGNKESKLEPQRAQEILNQMGCKDKKPEETIKDRTNGSIVKCGDVKPLAKQ